MDEAGFSGALGAIYDAAANPAVWPDTLGRLGALFGCSCVSLIDRNQHTLESNGTAWGVGLDTQRDYFTYWGRLNPIVRRKRAWRAGEIDTDRQILPKSDLVATDYYNGFMKPHDMHAILRLTLSTDSACHQVLNFGRPAMIGDYEEKDVDIARRLLPHLQRAGRISHRLRAADVMLDAITGVLEESAAAIVLLDTNGRVVFANASARAMAAERDVFVLRRQRLEAADRRDDALLQSLISRATRSDAPPEMPRGGAVRLSRISERRPCHAVVSPLPRGEEDEGAVAFVMITDPMAGVPDQQLIAELFDLSPAEVRVARRMMQGDTPEQAAEALAIRLSTTRWHLAALYRKTGTERQAQLIQVLASVPMLRPH